MPQFPNTNFENWQPERIYFSHATRASREGSTINFRLCWFGAKVVSRVRYPTRSVSPRRSGWVALTIEM